MSTETIARRYSNALADTVLEKGSADLVKGELVAWSQIFNTSAELRMVLGNPAIKYSAKANLLDGLIAKVKPSPTTANFLKILLRNGRLGAIAEINKGFESALEERSGLVVAEVTSARELQETERAEFEKNLAGLTGRKVRIDYVVDENMIGGVIARIGSKVYDGSVKTKLENLREQMINA